MSGIPRVCAEQLAERFEQQMCTRAVGLPGQLKVKNKDNRVWVMERDNFGRRRKETVRIALTLTLTHQINRSRFFIDSQRFKSVSICFSPPKHHL